MQSTEQLLRHEHDTIDPPVDHDDRLTAKRRRWLRFAGHYLEVVTSIVG